MRSRPFLANIVERVGSTLRDKWHLDRLIGNGGMAAVYEATHRNGMRGAVKVLHQSLSRDPDVAMRFRREGYIANKVEHRGAVRVLDDDVDDDGSAFLVMELLTGRLLSDRVDEAEARLTPLEMLGAVDQLLDVLVAAHERGIVHRDIKPENLVLTHEGELKVLDFGIAHLSEPHAEWRSVTLEGAPMGTPEFMSPEQARGRWDLVGPQSDLWSVGATMLMLLSGRTVHQAETTSEMLAAIFLKDAPKMRALVPALHPAIAAVIDRALERRLARRWPDALAMQAAVRDAYLTITGCPLSRPGIDSRRPTSVISKGNGLQRKGRGKWIAASALALLLLSFAARTGLRVASGAGAPRVAAAAVGLITSPVTAPVLAKRAAIPEGTSATASNVAVTLAVLDYENPDAPHEPARLSARRQTSGANASIPSLNQATSPTGAARPSAATLSSGPPPPPAAPRHLPTVYDRRY